MGGDGRRPADARSSDTVESASGKRRAVIETSDVGERYALDAIRTTRRSRENCSARCCALMDKSSGE